MESNNPLEQTQTPKRQHHPNVATFPDYLAKVDSITKWLEEAGQELNYAPPVHSELEGVKLQFNNHENFITRLMGQQSEVFNLLKSGKAMLEANLSMDKDEQRNMIDKMKKLNNLWEGIRVHTLEYQSRLQNALNSLQKQQIQAFEDWLCNVERIVEGHSHIKSEEQMSDLDKGELAKEFDTGIQLIKPLSNMLVVVDSEDDQEYKSLEDKLASLQTRYIKVCQWLDVNYHSILGHQLKTITQMIQNNAGLGLLNKGATDEISAIFVPRLESLKFWATETLGELGKLQDFSYNPHAWDPNELPDLKTIQDELALSEKELNEIKSAIGPSVTKVPVVAKLMENVERGLDYIKFKIDKIQSINSAAIPTKGSDIDGLGKQLVSSTEESISVPPIFKKIKLETTASGNDEYPEEDLESSPTTPLKTLPSAPLSEIGGGGLIRGNKLVPSKSLEIVEEILTPKLPVTPGEPGGDGGGGEMKTDEDSWQQQNMEELKSMPSSSLSVLKREQFKQKIPSIEISQVRDDDQYEAPITIVGDNQRFKDTNNNKESKVPVQTTTRKEQEGEKEDEELAEIPEHLAKRRDSLNVPTEFPELDSTEGEKQWEKFTNMSDRAPIPKADKLQISIYDINEALREIEYWFRDAKEKPKFSSVNQTKEFSEAIENCSAKLDQIKSIWPKIEEARNTARAIANATADGKDENANAVLKDSNNLIHRWEGLFEQTNNYFETLVNMLEAYHYQSFQEPLTSLNNWLDNIKSTLISDPNKYTDPEILTEKLNKVKEIQATIQDQSPNLTSIRSIWDEKSSDENFKFSMRDKFQSDIENVVAKYDNVKSLANDSAKELDSRLVLVKNYLEEIKVLKSWMDDLKKILDSEEKSQVVESSNVNIKEEEMKSLQENIDLLSPSLENINRVTPKILENADIDFAKKIRDEVRELNADWKRIVAQADKDKSLYDYDEYNVYMDRIANDLDAPVDISTEEDLKSQIKRLNNLKDDLLERKANFYSNLPSGLYPGGAIPPAQEEQLNSKFNLLMEKLLDRIDFYKTSLHDYKSYNVDLVKNLAKLQALQTVLNNIPAKESNDDVAKQTKEKLISKLEDPSILTAEEVPNYVKRKLSLLKEKANVLTRNKIMPNLVDSKLKEFEKLVNDVTPKIDKINKTGSTFSTTKKPIIPAALIPAAALKSDTIDSIKAAEPPVVSSPAFEPVPQGLTQLDKDILKLQEWIVHEDVMIMNHLDSDSKARDIPELEYQEMIREFKEKDALLARIKLDIDKLDDKAMANEISKQLEILQNRFDDLKGNMENFEFPAEIGSKLKKARITLNDIRDDILEIKPDNIQHDPKSTKDVLDTCMKNCYRLGDFKTNFENFSNQIPSLMANEKDDIKKSLDRKMKDCSNDFNRLADIANSKKSALEKKLGIAEKFYSTITPLKQWLDKNQTEFEKRGETFNVNAIDKEITSLQQMEAEIQQCKDLLQGTSQYLLSQKSPPHSFENGAASATAEKTFILPAIQAYDHELKELVDKTDKFKRDLNTRKQLYKEMNDDYEKFKDDISQVNTWIETAQSVLQSSPPPPTTSSSPLTTPNKESEKLLKTLRDLKEESDDVIKPSFDRAQTLGSKLIERSDNFRMVTRSELSSSKKQLDEILPELNRRLNDFATIFAPHVIPSGSEPSGPKSLEQDISFTIAKVNDFSRTLNPTGQQIKLPVVSGIGSEYELRNVLDPRVKALHKEYEDIDKQINHLDSKMSNGVVVPLSPSLKDEYEKARHTWESDVKPRAVDKLKDYEVLEWAWKCFLNNYADTRRFLVNNNVSPSQTTPADREKTRNEMKDLGLKDVNELREDAANAFAKTELQPLAQSLLIDLQNLRDGLIDRKDSYLIPKTPPPSPISKVNHPTKSDEGYYVGAAAALFGPALAAESAHGNKASSEQGSGGKGYGTPPPSIASTLTGQYEQKGVEPLALKERLDRAERGQDYSQEPYEFLWEIGNIQGLIDKMLVELKDPELSNAKVKAHPVRRHTLESIKGTIDDITPGIEGSEDHKNDVLRNVEDPLISNQIEESLHKLRKDWDTLISEYNNKLKEVSTLKKEGTSPQPSVMKGVRGIQPTLETMKFSPEKYYKAGPEEPAEALALVNGLQDIAHWLRDMESLINSPIPLFNESALRALKQTFKNEELNCPEKYRVLERAETSLADIKRTSNLGPEKIEKIAHLIAQAKEKHQAILADFQKRHTEIDDNYHRIFHLNQQIDDLSNWLKSTRENIEKSLPELKEEDIINLHGKMDERQPDIDQINYTFVQMVNEGLRYNELYDVDEFACPEPLRNQIKSLNADWDFLRDIDPKNIAKAINHQKLQETQPNLIATWPKIQRDLYEMTDKLNTTENAVSSRMVDVISPGDIKNEMSDIQNFESEVSKLKDRLDHIIKMGNQDVLDKAGYDSRQGKEAEEKCKELLNLLRHRRDTLKQMSQDCESYLTRRMELTDWIAVNAPILKELVQVKDKNNVTPAEYVKNHEYLTNKVPTYSQIVRELDQIARKMVTMYTDDDTTNLKAIHNDVSKLWFLVPLQNAQKVSGKHLIPVITALGAVSAAAKVRPVSTGQEGSLKKGAQQSAADILQGKPGTTTQVVNSYLLSPSDLKEFRQQMENFKVALVGEESALNVMNREIDKALKDRDEEHLNVWLDQIKEFQRDLESHRVGYNILNENGRKVLRDPSIVTSKEEAAQLRYKLDEINGKWENLRGKSNSLRNTLEEHYNPKNAISNSIDDALAWVTDKHSHLEMMKPLGGDVNTLRNQLDEISSFNAQVEEKRNPSIQDVVRNGQAYLTDSGYYKALDNRKEHLSPVQESKLKEGHDLENKIVTLDQKWCDLMDNSVNWEDSVTEMLKKMEEFNTDIAGLAVDYDKIRGELSGIDKAYYNNKLNDAAMIKYKKLLEALEETQPRLHDIHGKASYFLTRGLYLSKENDQRIQKLDANFETLRRDLRSRIKQESPSAQQASIEPSPTTPTDLMKRVTQLPLSPATKDSSKTSKTTETLAILKPKETSLPVSWLKAFTEAGVPYYINDKMEKTQWDHPLMIDILKSVSEMNYIKFAAYRTAAKLRILQKRLFLYLLNMGTAIDIMDSNNLRGKNNQTIGVSDVYAVSKNIYKTLAQDNPQIVTNVHLSTDLFVDWILDVYDSNRTGRINVLSIKVATILLCRAHLNDKYRYLYQLVADQYGSVNKEKLGNLLREMLRIPKYLGEVSSFGGSDPTPSVDNCFKSVIPSSHNASKESSSGTTPTITASDFIRWTDKDPQSIVWLPVLYRMAAAETARHQSKCNICKMYPIIGFRYRCLKCLNFDICQFCYFQGKRYKQHKPTHPLHEYSTPTTTGEDVKDLTKTLRNKLRPRRYFATHPRLGYTPINGVNVAAPQPTNSVLLKTGLRHDDGSGGTSPSVYSKGYDSHQQRIVGNESIGSSPEKVPLMPMESRDSGVRYGKGGQSHHHHQKSSTSYQYSGDNSKEKESETVAVPYSLEVNTTTTDPDSDEEHKLIHGFVKSLSSQPSPCVSKKSIDNSDILTNEYDQRMREIERGSCTLKMEYEQLMKIRNCQNFENRSLSGDRFNDSILVNHDRKADGCRDVLGEEGYGQSRSYVPPTYSSSSNVLPDTLLKTQVSPEETMNRKRIQQAITPNSENRVGHKSPMLTTSEETDPAKKSLLLVTDNLQRALGDLVSAMEETTATSNSPTNRPNYPQQTSPPAVQPCR